MADQFQLPSGATPAAGDPQQTANTSAQPQSAGQQFSLPEGATAANAVDQNTPGFWDHVKQGIKKTQLGQIVNSAFSAPENAEEAAAHAGGGDVGLFAYRQAKNLVALHKKLTDSNGPNWHEAANKFLDAAIDYGLSSDKDPVFSGHKHDAIMNTLSGTVDAMGNIQPATNLQQGSDLARSTTAQGQAEGLNPVTEATRSLIDVGTAAALAKTPEVPGAIEDSQAASAADAAARNPETATAPVKSTLTKPGLKAVVTPGEPAIPETPAVTGKAPFQPFETKVTDAGFTHGNVISNAVEEARTGQAGELKPDVGIKSNVPGEVQQVPYEAKPAVPGTPAGADTTSYQKTPSKIDAAAQRLSEPLAKTVEKISKLSSPEERASTAAQWIRDNPKLTTAGILAFGAEGKKFLKFLVEAL